METPRQGNEAGPGEFLSSARAPPATSRNKAEAIQTITASVTSQPIISCHAGSVKRKKFSGLPKIGSAMFPLELGAYQKRASDGHSDCIAAPVAREISSAMPMAAKCSTRPTGSSMERPAKKIVWLSGKSAEWARLRARNAPKIIRNVSAAKAAKVPH